MSGAQYRLTGRINVALPPIEAFRLFTPRGEEQWAAGWRPRFPVPTDDGTTPGTVFETTSHGEVTTWVVIDRERGRRIRYARVTPTFRAGTVTISIEENTDRRSSVQVSYELTALTAQGERQMSEFAAAYPDFLKTWEDAIAARVTTR